MVQKWPKDVTNYIDIPQNHGIASGTGMKNS
jgi:hypothetical protein